ncbi:MAG: SRPBCC family protein [Myxococcota bacterium]
MSRDVERTAIVAASPEEVWAYFADIPKWTEWDHDFGELVENRGGLTENGGFVVTANVGLTLHVRFEEVEAHRRFVWPVSALGGLFVVRGEFVLTPTDDGQTELFYRFGPRSMITRLIDRLGRQQTIEGTERGLANIVSHFEGAAAG